MRRLIASSRLRAALAALTFTAACSTGGPQWADANRRVIEQNNVTGRTREVPSVRVPMKLADGEPVEAATLPTVTIAPGVTATLGWGRGALLERVDMAAGAVYPSQTLNEELIVIGQEGSATIEFDGKTAELTKDQVLYLAPGSVRSLKAGAAGWKAFEVYSPVRLDHLRLAGQDTSAANVTFRRSGRHSLASARRRGQRERDPVDAADRTRRREVLPSQHRERAADLGEERANQPGPDGSGSTIGLHIHPEDQLTHTVRGSLEQGVIDRTFPASGQAGHVVFLPGGMVHSAKLGEVGADQLDVFWPVRPDYVDRAGKQRTLYEQIVAPDAKPQKLADGFTFAEGPTWLKGKLYFSDMFFQNPAANDWTGSPARSRLIVMEAPGKWRPLSTGMQSNGTIAARNGNLLVCDMFGHRVVEVDPATGRVVRVVLDKVNGKPIDGPNDLVMDAKGGLYITDPQFTPEAQKSQPGKQVYYVAPDGTARVVIGPGEYAMPNGVELSPDGKRLYVNNTWAQPGENFVWAYDVAADGSLSNKRQFGVLNRTADVLGAAKAGDRFSSGADGSAVDTDGRYYVATNSGVQIFLPDGTYAGTIWLPEPPISVTFGGANSDVLYMVSPSSAWAIQTKVRGFRYPEGIK